MNLRPKAVQHPLAKVSGDDLVPSDDCV